MGQSDCFSEMFAHLHTYMKKGMFVDVYFIIGDCAIGAHKAVLVSNSKVFCAMFETEMKESQTQEVVISDVDEEAFRTFLDYVYSRNEKNVKNHVEKLFMLADKYDIEPLVVSCESYILQSLDKGNVVEYFQLSDLYRREDLKKSIIDFIKRNLKYVIHTDEWLYLKSKNPQLVSEVIQHLIVEELIGVNKVVESYDEVDHRFCDAVIKHRGREFPVHKFILSGKSTVFKANRTEIEIPDSVSLEDFKVFLDYVYCNTLPDVTKISRKLICLSQAYQLGKLTNHCVSDVMSHIGLKSAINAKIIGHVNTLESLKSAAIKFVVKNLDDLYNTEEWKMLLYYPDLLTEIHMRVSIFR